MVFIICPFFIYLNLLIERVGISYGIEAKTWGLKANITRFTAQTRLPVRKRIRNPEMAPLFDPHLQLPKTAERQQNTINKITENPCRRWPDTKSKWKKKKRRNSPAENEERATTSFRIRYSLSKTLSLSHSDSIKPAPVE